MSSRSETTKHVHSEDADRREIFRLLFEFVGYDSLTTPEERAANPNPFRKGNDEVSSGSKEGQENLYSYNLG